MPSWIMKIARDWLFNKGTSGLAAEIKTDDPAIIPALRAYDAGATFMEMVKVYVTATNDKGTQAVNTAIEEFRADLETKPFNEVLPLLARDIASRRIPDGDGDSTNDITIGEVFERIKNKIIE